MSVCLSVTLLQIDSSSFSSLFFDGIEPFLGHQFSMTKATKRCSSNFDFFAMATTFRLFLQKFQIASSFLFFDGIEPFLAVSSP